MPRPIGTGTFNTSDLVEYSGSQNVLYGLNNSDTEGGFRRLGAGPCGALVLSNKWSLLGAFNPDFKFDNGLVYGSSGWVADPETGTLVGRYRFADGPFGNGNRIAVAVDSAAGRVRTGEAATAATVSYQTNDGTASERADYTAAFGTLHFAPNELAKQVTVFITDDARAESPETFTLSLSSPTGALLGTTSTLTVTINDNDVSNGTNNPADDSQFFVRQHYRDFLNREPDAPGLAFWTNEIEQCGTNAQCRDVKRINVSAAFFLSIEFQETGYLVERMYKTAYGEATSPNVAGTVPVVRLREFLADTQQTGRGLIVGQGDWQAQLEANKAAFALEFVQRTRFTDAFPLTLTPAQFVDKLNTNAGGVLDLTERANLINELTANNTNAGRASVLCKVAEDSDLRSNERNRAFVLMQFYGYMRRNPDDPQDTDFRGWKFWLDKLNQFNGNFVTAEMVKAFITSDEYRHRFGQ